MLELFLAASATALATGLGAIPVFMLGEEKAEALKPALLGLAGGVMTVAAVAGLLVPAWDEGGPIEVMAGIAIGVAFLLVARSVFGHVRPAASRAMRTSALVFFVLLVHSLPEGFAIGTAFASDTEGLALFVVLAIGIQNIPEGTSVAIPMAAAGQSAARQFWAAVATSIPQPIGAVVAFVLVEQVSALLAVSFAFAAGAMLALVVVEVAPSALRAGPGRALAGGAVGAALMLALSWLLGV
jgi:zinc transporter, ZIP family